MASSVFWTAITIVAVLLGLLVNPFFLIAAVTFVVIGLFTAFVLRKATDTSIGTPEAPPSGTATTREASYDPAGGDAR